MRTSTLIIGTIIMLPALLIMIFQQKWKTTFFPFFNGPEWAVIVIVAALCIGWKLYVLAQKGGSGKE